MTIHAFTGNGEAVFGSLVDNILTQAPDFGTSDLCAYMNHYNTDKGKGRHNYTPLYDALLKDSRYTTKHVFELGIGTAQDAVALPGPSLRAWRDYFPYATVLGADIDPGLLFEDNRIASFGVDARDFRKVQQMWREVQTKFGADVKFDLILDDGVHAFDTNSVFLSQSWRMVKPGGFYIIEDVTLLPMNVASIQGFIEGLELDGVVVELPHKWNHEDNCVAIMQKPLV